jgi:hypothetical protein
VLLHVFGHVDLDQRLGAAEHELGQVLREEGLADAGGAEEEEGANRTAWIFEVGAGTAQRLADGDDGFVLADDLAF